MRRFGKNFLPMTQSVSPKEDDVWVHHSTGSKARFIILMSFHSIYSVDFPKVA
jgi:hypothetical protein